MSKASSGTGRIIDCPACGQTIEDLWDDNEGLREGERIECPLCEAILTVEAVHVEMHLRLSTTAPPASGEEG